MFLFVTVVEGHALEKAYGLFGHQRNRNLEFEICLLFSALVQQSARRNSPKKISYLRLL
eukprot:m.81004 g.81004  ORF g.81004 m.81004 type:complete len:59 (+) comp36213_c0_seq2:1706-1882(+)